MTYLLVALALLAGAGLGFAAGLYVADDRLEAMTLLQERTIEKVASNVAHPGAKDRVLQAAMATEQLYDSADVDPSMPEWMDEEFDPFDQSSDGSGWANVGEGDDG